MGKVEFKNHVKGIVKEWEELEKTVQKLQEEIEQLKLKNEQILQENKEKTEQLKTTGWELQSLKNQLQMQKEMSENYIKITEKQEVELNQYRNKYARFEEQQGYGKGRARAFSERYWIDYLTRWALHEEIHDIKTIHAKITAKAVEKKDRKMEKVSYETVRTEVRRIRLENNWSYEVIDNRTVWNPPQE